MKREEQSKCSTSAELAALRQTFAVMRSTPAAREICRLVDLMRREVAERKRVEGELRASEEQFRLVVDSADDSIYLIDRKGCYLFVNSTHLGRIGLRKQEVIGRPYGEFHAPSETVDLMRQMRRVLRTGRSHQAEHTSKRDGGCFMRTLSPVLDEQGRVKAVTVVSKNVTALKTMEERFHTLSLTDELTGLYNRRGFKALADQQLKIARRMRRPLLMVYADIDDLKKINDSLGHALGDYVIKQAATLLRRCFRESDIVARIGGDEFVVLVTDVAEEAPARYQERFLDKVARSNARRRRFKLSLSVGTVTCEPSRENSVDRMLAVADRAMYRQKEARRRGTAKR